MLRQIIIPIAAFAVTVTAASAFTGDDMLSKLDIGLTDAQESALQEAHTIREEANEKAQNILTNAGIDDVKMREIHEAMRGVHQAQHEAMKTAIDAKDFVAFTKAIKDSPLALIIDTEDEFNKFIEAHKLMESGDREGAKEIMDELGMKGPMGGFGGEHGRMHGGEAFGSGDHVKN